MPKTTLPQAPVQRPDDAAEIVRLMAEALMTRHKQPQKWVRDESANSYWMRCGWNPVEIDFHGPAALSEFVRLAAADAGERV